MINQHNHSNSNRKSKSSILKWHLELCPYCNSPFTLQVEPCIDNTSTVTSVDKPVAWYNILNSHLIQKFTLWLYGPSIGCHSCNKPTRVLMMNLLKLAWKLGFSNVNFLLLSGRCLAMLGWISISDIFLSVCNNIDKRYFGPTITWKIMQL